MTVFVKKADLGFDPKCQFWSKDPGFWSNLTKMTIFRQNAGCRFCPKCQWSSQIGSKIETKMTIWCQLWIPKWSHWAHALSETGSKGHGSASMTWGVSRSKLPIILYYYLWDVHYDPDLSDLTSWIQILPTFLAESGPEIVRIGHKSGQDPFGNSGSFGQGLDQTRARFWSKIGQNLIDFWSKIDRKWQTHSVLGESGLCQNWQISVLSRKCRFWPKFGCKWTLQIIDFGSKIGWVVTRFWPKLGTVKGPFLPIWLLYPYEMAKIVATGLLESQKVAIFMTKSGNNPSKFWPKTEISLSPFPSKLIMPQHVCSNLVLDVNFGTKFSSQR